jgi:hypothetical protein
MNTEGKSVSPAAIDDRTTNWLKPPGYLKDVTSPDDDPEIRRYHCPYGRTGDAMHWLGERYSDLGVQQEDGCARPGLVTIIARNQRKHP